tara:strand:+ start:1620 stop:2489 length:870 start_codon:yes stop_codon:yes gene_type:complete
MAAAEPSAIRFGPFVVDTVLGSGAMATVYAGRHPRLGKVALKVATAPEFGELLRREHALLHRFEHPGIPRPLSYLEVVGRPTLVMTHLTGRPLGERFDRGEPRDTVACAISLLEVLDHVHRRGVVHCDVKPQNVLRGRQAQLLDFGIARDIGASSTDAQGRVAGTPAYMAPEVLKGREVTAATDLYSLAVLLYRGLTGRFPFPTDRHLHLAAKEDLVWLPPSVVRDQMPEALDDLLESMLNPDPTRRPPSAAVRQVLREVAPQVLERPCSAVDRPVEPGTTQRVALDLG